MADLGRPAADAQDLGELLSTRRVILCVGCGGVGKTTTTAALGVAAALRGMRVLCLTIDPARRLSQSLGLSEMTTEAQVVDPALFAAAGIRLSGSMTVMMLDTKSTFDALVRKLARTPEKEQRILDNVIYRYVSTSLAGTQEYMAMEKLHEVKADPRFDVILLDTPPTSHALDFLDAPERLVGALDSAATRWFVQAFQGPGRLSLNLFAKSTASILRGIGKLTGAGFFEEIAEFISEINEIFGGWRTRASEVAADLRGPDVGYVLVTTPDPLSVREVLYFAERLREQGMRSDAFVVNRVHPVYGPVPSEDDIKRELVSRGLSLDEHACARLRRASADESNVGAQDASYLQVLLDAIKDDDRACANAILVPAFPYDIHDIHRLAQVARLLVPPAPSVRCE